MTDYTTRWLDRLIAGLERSTNNNKQYWLDYITQLDERMDYVYLIRMVGTDLYKIGYSCNLEARFLNLTSMYPLPIGIVHTIETNRGRWLERRLHLKYRRNHVYGEWYVMSEREVKHFKKLNFEYVRYVEVDNPTGREGVMGGGKFYEMTKAKIPKEIRRLAWSNKSA